jgi:hypothetical protein
VLLKEGLFVDGDFDTPRFLRSIDDTVVSFMKTMNAEAHSNRRNGNSSSRRTTGRTLRILGYSEATQALPKPEEHGEGRWPGPDKDVEPFPRHILVEKEE